MILHPKLTLEVVLAAAERAHRTLDNPGFCIMCAHEQDGCEPDMREGTCEACGEAAVYGAEELLLQFF